MSQKLPNFIIDKSVPADAGNRRIALFVPSLRGGGAERVMVILANSFARRDYEVDLILAQAQGPYLSEVDDLVRIVDLKSRRTLSSLPRLVQYLRKERPMALLSTLRHANITASAAKFLSASKARLVLREANHIDERNFAGPSGRIQLMLYRWAYSHADAVVGISNGVRDTVEEVIGHHHGLRRIYNPLRVEHVRRMAQEEVEPWVKRILRPIIVATGRLTPQKDFHTILEAFALLATRTPAHLIILGEGKERASLEHHASSLGISDHVSMPGFVANPFAIMKSSSLFVLSSRWEGFGNVLIEAMACEIPIVSTDCPSGPREILEEGKWGRLVPIGDPQRMADAIFATLNDHDRPALLKRAQQFHVEEIVESYLEVLLPPENHFTTS